MQEQTAAVHATSMFRSQMTQDGQRLAAALNTSPRDLDGARKALAMLRTQIPADASGLTVLDQGVATTASEAQQAAAAQQAQTLEFVLTRVILPPSAIDLVVQRQAEWLSATTDAVFHGHADGVSLGELQATGDSMSDALTAISELGELRSPTLMTAVNQSMIRLRNALSQGTSPREIVTQCDTLTRQLAELATPLEGFGRDALYQ